MVISKNTCTSNCTFWIFFFYASKQLLIWLKLSTSYHSWIWKCEHAKERESNKQALVSKCQCRMNWMNRSWNKQGQTTKRRVELNNTLISYKVYRTLLYIFRLKFSHLSSIKGPDSLSTLKFPYTALITDLELTLTRLFKETNSLACLQLI